MFPVLARQTLCVENVPDGFTVGSEYTLLVDGQETDKSGTSANLIPGDGVSIEINLTPGNGGTCQYTIDFTPVCGKATYSY